METGLGSPAIFEPTHEMGEYFVKLNRNHVAYEKFMELTKPANDEESAANNGLKLLLRVGANGG